MQQKVNFIWIYALVLVIAAICLVSISAVARMEMQPTEVSGKSEAEVQKNFNQTAQQSIALLIDENNDFKAQIDGFVERVLGLEGENASLLSENENMEKLFSAIELYNNSKNKDSFEELGGVDFEKLGQFGKRQYEILELNLARKGFNK